MEPNNLNEYRENILPKYEPLHEELYTMNAEAFFVPEFLKAVKDNTKEGYKKIMVEPIPGVLIFDMFKPSFCQMLIDEVENIQSWVHQTGTKIKPPEFVNIHGLVLDDFGMETMLFKLVRDFVSPIAGVFFREVGGAALDSHVGFVVKHEAGKKISKQVFNVDNAEVTLNVCLGKRFSGGEQYFSGVRCQDHMYTYIQPEEIMDYVHVPGRAVIHHGRNRHGDKITTAGERFNLVVWCKSSMFREMCTNQIDFPNWCGKCLSDEKMLERLLREHETDGGYNSCLSDSEF